ncbi:MAG: extracellular solute-binding protein [Clostridia bacterium]|nr:extracellular solute-binding protein [Clostridia bacterium]
MKKALALLLGTVLLIALSAGFVTGSGEQPELGTDRLELTWMVHDFVNAPTKDDSIANKFFEDRFNIAIHFETVNFEDYNTKLGLVLATDDRPDLVWAMPWEGGLSMYYDTGLVAELTPYLDTYAPDFMAIMNGDPSLAKNVKDDQGRYFFFPQLLYGYDREGVAMRMDWLEELGLPVPTTTDEFFDAVLAMKTLDPKVIPITSGQYMPAELGLPRPFYRAFGTWETWFPFSESEYLFGPYERSEEMRACLKWLNALYEAGAIDQDYLTVDQDASVAKMMNDEVGAIYGWMGGDHMWPKNADGTYDEYYNWDVILPLKGPGGLQIGDAADLVGHPTYITSSCPEIERVISFFNWCYSEEGIDFLNYGIEGVTYTFNEDGTREYMKEFQEHEYGLGNGLRAAGFLGVTRPYVNRPDNAFAASPSTVRYIEASKPFERLSFPNLTPTPEEVDIDVQLGADILKYCEDTLPLFVVGQLNTDGDFDAFLTRLEAMRVEEYIANKRAQYERWQAR